MSVGFSIFLLPLATGNNQQTKAFAALITAAAIVLQILKPCVIRQIRQMNAARRPVSLLGDDDLGLALGLRIFVAVLVLVVVALAMNKGHHVSILLNRAGLAQVAQ